MAERYLKHPSDCNINIMRELPYNLKDEGYFWENSCVGGINGNADSCTKKIKTESIFDLFMKI